MFLASLHLSDSLKHTTLAPLFAFALFNSFFEYSFLGIQVKQQQQQCIYLKKYKVYNTSCPANSYNANLGRTRL